MSVSRGTVLGRYEIVEPIGAGGMGEVYRASDVTLRREIALKILPESVVGDTTRFARFEQEARATAALRHPNIVTIHDFGVSDYGPYLVTELLEGETLADALARGGLPLRRVISWAQQILRGLAAAHARGIIHRDLKPGNIFVTAEGVVKILDFGLAKIDRADRGESLIDSPTDKMSAAGSVLGTVGYMSPEQVVAGDIDARTDIFSFGIVLYEMLTRRSPFLRATSAETIAAILRDDPPLLDAPTFPAALALTLQRCLAKNREERFHSAHDLALHLETIEIAGSTGSGAAVAASGPLPDIEQITFRRGNIMAARFAPDGSIVYGASWNDETLQLYVSHRGTPESRGVGIAGSIHSISRSGEMAVSLGRRSELGFQFSGTLARGPLAGGVPRAVANDIYDADWSPDGKQLAITRRSAGGFRLEYPMGRTIYESPAWISDLRVSPNGTEIAFVEHPLAGDNFGHVKVIGLDGNGEQLTDDIYICWGLAWHPLSGEIWYTAAPPTDESRGLSLYALSRQSKPREVFATLGSLVLRDIAPDGTVLITSETLRRHIVGHIEGEERPRDLSWFDWSFPMAVSSDGTLLLFEEQGVASGGKNTFYIRGMDGSPAVRLDYGRARDLSPDGAYVLAFRNEGAVERLMMVPTGAGESRDIEVRGIDHFQTARFLPDGQAIVVVGSRTGERPRLWRCAVTGGDAVPLTEPMLGSWNFIAISPDGNFVATVDDNQIPILCSTSDNGAPRSIPRAQQGDSPVFWPHENELLICRREDRASHLYSVDLTSGDTKFVRTLQPADIAGVQGILPIHYARNGRGFVYGYRLLLSSLFIIKGLR